MTKFTLIPYSEYYFKARDAIPLDHPHRDEIVSLLIDQVLDDSYGYSQPNSSTGSSGEGPD